jgi:fructose-1,6-bisphosphatase/inositol monophosphatase family enzyme
MPEVLLATARAAAEAGASVVRRLFRDATLGVERKGANDFVTEADRGSERAIVEAIRRRHPDHAVLAEEGTGGGAVSAGQVEWLIDPLDGTTNFLQGLPMFCVSVACRRDGELLAGVVLDPVRDEVFEAARGAGATWNGRPKIGRDCRDDSAARKDADGPGDRRGGGEDRGRGDQENRRHVAGMMPHEPRGVHSG